MGIAIIIKNLEVFYTSTNRKERKEADNYLETFQRSKKAWEISNQLLSSTETNNNHKLFAAQTFRTKVISLEIVKCLF